MSNASTKKKAEHDSMPEIDLTSGRYVRRPGRGAHAHKRLELPLAGVRRLAGKTQVEVAEAANMAQGDVSRLEGQDDMMLSTLKRYVEALGLRVEIAVVLPNDARVFLKL
jgi:hypothetical protein